MMCQFDCHAPAIWRKPPRQLEGKRGDESNDRRRSLSQPPPRSRPGGRKPNGPFCWQDKRWLGLIRKETEDYASGLSVYLALTELASDNESNYSRQPTPGSLNFPASARKRSDAGSETSNGSGP